MCRNASQTLENSHNQLQHPLLAFSDSESILAQLRSTSARATRSQFNELGFSTLKLARQNTLAVFSIPKLPVGDLGACELAHVVINELKALGPCTRFIAIEIGAIDHRHDPVHSDGVQNNSIFYPVWIIEQVLPIGVAYKFIVNDEDFFNQMNNAYPNSVVSDLSEASQQLPNKWCIAGRLGAEPERLLSWQEQVEWALVAINKRRLAALELATSSETEVKQ